MGLYVGYSPVNISIGGDNRQFNYYVSPTLAPNYSWYKSEINRSNFTEINIVDTYTPTGSEIESWNADAHDNGDIKCYVVGTNLIIAGNGTGKLYANPDSTNLFSGSSDYVSPGVVNTNYCFNNVTTINGLQLIDTSKVVDMSFMFTGCKSLTVLDLSSFDTSKVVNMPDMFSNCDSLTVLDLSSFDTSKVVDMECMFLWDSSLTTIYASDFWNTDNVIESTYMFLQCNKLVGDIAINTSYLDKTYAKTTGGYLTYKEYIANG